jgi:hypothetical protein
MPSLGSSAGRPLSAPLATADGAGNGAGGVLRSTAARGGGLIQPAGALAGAPSAPPPTHAEIDAMAVVAAVLCPVCHGRKEDDLGSWCVGCGGIGRVPRSCRCYMGNT